MKAIVEGFRTITATILESNHLACFVAQLLSSILSSEAKREKKAMEWGLCRWKVLTVVLLSLQKQAQKTQICNSQNKNGQKHMKMLNLTSNPWKMQIKSI